jgi:class 3 adenylate cyclase/tetratricopeptide (TPR) repeat protein
MSTEPLTVLITDMEGSTAFIDTRGDALAMDLIRVHEQLVREVVRRHAGREIKSMGDGFMIAFTRAEAGVACALDILHALDRHNESHSDAPIRVRMGINTGPVIEEGGDLYGTTVNAASRISAKARSGQVLVSEQVRADTADAGDWNFIDRGLFWLKGLRERWPLYEVTRGAPAPRATAPEGRVPFIDREDERAALRVYVDAALDGRGGLVLLAGDTGSGKTRLAEEVGLEASGRGMRLLVGRCYEASQTHPFGPFVDILETVERSVSPETFRTMLGDAAGEIARLIPHIRRRYPDVPAPAELPDPDQARRYLFASVRDVLAGMARDRPLYLILDDLHWSDEPSLLFLEQLTLELANLPIFVIGTYIQAELGASRALQTMIEVLHRRRLVERFHIGPLAEDDLGALLEALAGKHPPAPLVQRLYRETEGNVFFAEEVVRHLLEQERIFDAAGEWRADLDVFELDLPETVRMTIGRRLEGLDESTRGVLTTAAVVGRAFGFDLLEVLTEMSEEDLIDALDEAERSRVIISTSEGGAVQFRFSHELIRQTLVSDVSLTRRQLLHHRIAGAMESVYASSIAEHAVDMAYHLREAGRRADPRTTTRFLVLAGERALEAAAYEEAARHFDRALALIPPTDDAARAPVLEKLGAAERSLGHPDDSISTWREALDAYQAAGDVDAVARLALEAGIQVAWWLRRKDTVVLADRGLKALGDVASNYRAGLLALKGIVESQAGGSYDRAVELLDEALEMARRQDDDRILGMVLYSKAAHHFAFSEFPETVDFGTESIDYLRSGGDLWNLANVLGYVGQSLGWIGQFDEAARITEGAKDLAERLGNWVAYVYVDRARAWRHLARRPDPDRLIEDGRRDLELGRRLGYPWLQGVGHARMSVGAFQRGRWDEAIASAEASAQFEGGAAGGGHTGRLFAYHAYAGHRDEAMAILGRLRTAFPTSQGRYGTSSWNSLYFVAEGLAVLGEREEAAALHPLVARGVSAGGTLFRGWDYRVLHTVAGISATCARSWDEAEAHFTAAADLVERLPFRAELPEMCRFYAQMLIERDGPGDDDRAREMLSAAIEASYEFGMPAHERLARDVLDTL